MPQESDLGFTGPLQIQPGQKKSIWTIMEEEECRIQCQYWVMAAHCQIRKWLFPASRRGRCSPLVGESPGHASHAESARLNVAVIFPYAANAGGSGLNVNIPWAEGKR